MVASALAAEFPRCEAAAVAIVRPTLSVAAVTFVFLFARRERRRQAGGE